MNIQGIGQNFIPYHPPPMTGTHGSSGQPIQSVESVNQSIDSVAGMQEANLDGVSTSDEAAAFADMFSNADTDGDSYLSQEEFEQMLTQFRPQQSSGMRQMESGQGMQGMGPPPPPKDFDQVLDDRDINGDGVISAEESGLTTEMFSTLDADGDGSITSQEHDQFIDDTKGSEQSASVNSTSLSTGIMAYQKISYSSLAQEMSSDGRANLISTMA
ncbi:MAG: hypothetical protein GY729_17010 [Desulfobacteraceae bacterium]|nr:hypothetical protein [Desulfobacteraceae bacterium]